MTTDVFALIDALDEHEIKAKRNKKFSSLLDKSEFVGGKTADDKIVIDFSDDESFKRLVRTFAAMKTAGVDATIKL